MQKPLILLFSLLFSVVLSACSHGVRDGVAASLSDASSTPQQAMVVTANPLATKAGADVLRAGGSAVDAAIAIEAVLSLVEPQSSGLAGGGFMVYYDRLAGAVTVYDGRETAPKNIDPRQFLDDQGQSIGYLNAKHSGLSTGVPGMVSMLALAHSDHGKLPWGAHFSAAKQLAIDGFSVSARLHYFINRFGKYLPKTEADGPTDAYRYFFNDDGSALSEGAVIKNPAYAKTLDIIGKDPRAFYTGELAQDIVAQTATKPRAGALTLSDMANFKAQKKAALCSPYKSKTLCGPPPPSSWLAVGEIMGLIESGLSFEPGGAASAKNWVMFAEAQRLAYADRDQYVGDTAFVDMPITGMLSADYWQQRIKDAGPQTANSALKAGNPWQYETTKKVAYGEDNTDDVAGTTHFVVIDAQGDVVSMTATVESIFGSARMAGGMFLNNQLTDFAFNPLDKAGKPVANRIEPLKRPRSSMSPTIVLDENGEFIMATGSPGGNSIIAYTAKTLVGVFEWGLSPQDAVNLPNLVARGEKVRIEKERANDSIINGLKNYGFNVKESAGENSGLSVIYRNPNGELDGGVDPRREGTIEIIEVD